IAARALAAVLSASLVGLFVLPVVALFFYAGGSGLAFAAGDSGFRTALEFTLLASGMAVGLGLLTGVPLGYVLARYRFPGRAVLESVVTIPIVIPHLVVGIGLLLLFAPNSPVGRFTAALGIPIFDAVWGVVLVMLYVGASYIVLTSQLAFRSVDEEVIEAARSLGAGPGEVFATVTLPAAARGILTGALLMWARGVSEVGGFLILAYAVYPTTPWNGPVTNAASVWIYNYWGIDPTAAVGASALLVLVALAIFLAVRLLDRTGFAWARGGFFS
ncbi:MAG: ABC transporter permease, partial [Candidatus Lutacidiplasmatales archaeon]